MRLAFAVQAGRNGISGPLMLALKSLLGFNAANRQFNAGSRASGEPMQQWK
jgi:hypothetical protein